MIQSAQVFNKIGFCFQFQDRVGSFGEIRDKQSRQLCKGVQQKGIGKFSCPDPVQAAPILRKVLRKFAQHIIEVAEQPEIGLVQVGLKDTIGAVERALDAEMQDSVPAAVIVTRSRTGFQKLPPKLDHFNKAWITAI